MICGSDIPRGKKRTHFSTWQIEFPVKWWRSVEKKIHNWFDIFSRPFYARSLSLTLCRLFRSVFIFRPKMCFCFVEKKWANILIINFNLIDSIHTQTKITVKNLHKNNFLRNERTEKQEKKTIFFRKLDRMKNIFNSSKRWREWWKKMFAITAMQRCCVYD